MNWPSSLPDVSRETLERLQTYVELLKSWNRKINLVSQASLGDVWSRHILDSAQLIQFLPQKDVHWVDMGSGGGLPGLVMAILLKELSPTAHVTMIESDQRKAVFLRACIRETQVNARVIDQRIEQAPPQAGDVVSARALASVNTLLPHTLRHLAPNGFALFLKGRSAPEEIEEARKFWRFSLEVSSSITDPEAHIIKLSDIELGSG